MSENYTHVTDGWSTINLFRLRIYIPTRNNLEQGLFLLTATDVNSL